MPRACPYSRARGRLRGPLMLPGPFHQVRLVDRGPQQGIVDVRLPGDVPRLLEQLQGHRTALAEVQPGQRDQRVCLGCRVTGLPGKLQRLLGRGAGFGSSLIVLNPAPYSASPSTGSTRDTDPAASTSTS